jgi:hypothetical protein
VRRRLGEGRGKKALGWFQQLLHKAQDLRGTSWNRAARRGIAELHAGRRWMETPMGGGAVMGIGGACNGGAMRSGFASNGGAGGGYLHSRGVCSFFTTIEAGLRINSPYIYI